MSTLQVGNILNENGDDIPDNLVPTTAKAWVSFVGTGTVTILDSYNVSSVTDVGTGTYRPNYATAMGTTDYSPNVSSNKEQTFYVASGILLGSTEFVTENSSGTVGDADRATLVVF